MCPSAVLISAYELVRNDKDDTTWLLLDYEVCVDHARV